MTIACFDIIKNTLLTIAWSDIIKETLLITSFVILVMLIIEYLNVITKGTLSNKIHKNPSIQIIIAAILGVIPGCMGVFTVVSFYTNGLMSFGALLAAMIATTGDEAFFMLAYIPKEAIIIFIILFIVSIIVGFIANKLVKNKYITKKNDGSLSLENDLQCKKNSTGRLSIQNFNLNPKRIILLFLFLSVFVLAVIGVIGHSHSEHSVFNLLASTEMANPISGEECSHEHHHQHEYHGHHHHHQDDVLCHDDVFDWVRLSIAVTALFSMIVVLLGTDHFVYVHIWEHLLKGHFIKIFLWTFATLLIINILFGFADIGSWLMANKWIVLLIALLIGVIPESGPHLIFVILYIQGSIPFSVLLANSLMQNGHGPLPLLADSKKSFLIIKLLGFIIGGLIGVTGILFGF